PMLAARLPGSRAAESSRRGPVALAKKWSAEVFAGMEAVYLGLLRDALNARVVTVLLSIVLVGASFYLFPFIGTELMPPSDEGEVRVSGEMEVGTRLELVDRQTRLMEEIVLGAVPEMRSAVV